MATKPEAEFQNKIAYNTKTSYVGMPISVAIKDIQTVLNQNITHLIYADSILADDNMEIKIWKTNAIQLSAENGKIKSVLPVKIWVKYRYGTQFMGLNDTREFNFNGTFTFLSDVALSNWHLSTKSNLQRIVWNESPNIQIGNKQVAITYLINPAMNWFKKDIANQVDQAIAKTCDFKPQVLDALKALAEPRLVNDKYETWLSINPLEIYATDATLEKNNVVLNMGLKANIRTVIGNKPQENVNWNQLKITKVKSIPNYFNGTIAAITTYKSAARVITNNFKGETFSSGKKKITIQEVDMWQQQDKIIIALTLQGSLNGTIYLSGIPKYNVDLQQVYFEQLDYVLNTKNVLHKSASWLLNGLIVRKIQENCTYSIANDIETGKTIAQQFLTHYSPMKGVYIDGKMDNLTFDRFELLNHAMVSYINTNGNVAISIQGLE
ncbi:DUF4403 family protein [Flavobacterium agricola]|uniref:DUF4403 family protein n=1 Tax=Flavobacterium agricola TaxID=2870839 RepID=A0ABY6LWP0_9FLAO|nr:DUF4403 family protein [Flavobacterium agricola]UYW00754.1 DUF4403 family protein [Flavobacterium agricola]